MKGMSRTFFRKLRAHWTLLALAWAVPFAVQSVALPVHATEHALHAADSAQGATPQLVAADCGLCTAFHSSSHSLAASSPRLAPVASIVATPALSPAPVFTVSHTSPLARGPPSAAV